MSNPTGPRVARQVIIPTPVPGSPPLFPRVFQRNRHIRHIWPYAQTSIREGLWPRPTTADAAARVIWNIFDEAREAIEEVSQ